MAQFKIRNALPEEFSRIGQLMVHVYSGLEGFPKPDEQPKYYQMLENIGELTKKPLVELLVAIGILDNVSGAVVFFGDMMHYGSGGTATTEKNASGFRLLAVDPVYRGIGLGKALTIACIEKAKSNQSKQLIIHTTIAMQRAWGMYEELGFKRSPDLDFMQESLQVYGFRLML